MVPAIVCQVKVNLSLLTSNNHRGNGWVPVPAMMTFFESGSNIQISCSLVVSRISPRVVAECLVLFGTGYLDLQPEPPQPGTVRWDRARLGQTQSERTQRENMG